MFPGRTFAQVPRKIRAWFKTGSGTVVQRTNRAVPATAPASYLEPSPIICAAVASCCHGTIDQERDVINFPNLR